MPNLRGLSWLPFFWKGHPPIYVSTLGPQPNPQCGHGRGSPKCRLGRRDLQQTGQPGSATHSFPPPPGTPGSGALPQHWTVTQALPAPRGLDPCSC